MDSCKIVHGLYQYTAIDNCTCYRVLRVYARRTASNTLNFIDSIIEEMPFPIQRIPTDRGREFFAGIVQERLKQQGIRFRPSETPRGKPRGIFNAALSRAAQPLASPHERCLCDISDTTPDGRLHRRANDSFVLIPCRYFTGLFKLRKGLVGKGGRSTPPYIPLATGRIHPRDKSRSILRQFR